MRSTPPYATGTLHPHFGAVCPPPAHMWFTLLCDSRRSADELSSSDSTDLLPTSCPRPRSGIQINSPAKGNLECAPSPAVAPPPRDLAAAIEIAACRDMLAAVASAPVIDVRAAGGAHVRRMLPLHVRAAPAARRGRRRAAAAAVSGRVARSAPCASELMWRAAVGLHARPLWWSRSGSAASARVTRAELRTALCGRHGGAAYVANMCMDLCLCATCAASHENGARNVFIMSVRASAR